MSVGRKWLSKIVGLQKKKKMALYMKWEQEGRDWREKTAGRGFERKTIWIAILPQWIGSVALATFLNHTTNFHSKVAAWK